MADSRYHRQILIPEIGVEGQRKLAEGRVLLVGCGALGCAIADQLARAGVGSIRIADRDTVEPTNLQRQTLYAEADVGRAKVEAAADRLRAINSTIEIEPVAADVTAENAEELAVGVDAILDGTDNFETRFLLNDLAVKRGVPYAYGGVIAARGMAATFVPRPHAHATPCLRCIIPTPPPAASVPTCDTAGVLGPAVAIVAAQQAADAIKMLLGRFDLLGGTMLDFDLMANSRRRYVLADLAPEDGCRACGERRFDFLERESGGDARALCGRNAVQVTPGRVEDGARAIPLDALADRLGLHGSCQRIGPLLKANVESDGRRWQLTIFPDGRTIVAGTEDPAEARSVYARLIGA
ncbi:MAG: ThiF family adenylyltransferase [Planctomycetota bacterium]